MLCDFYLVQRDGRDQVMRRDELGPADIDWLVAKTRADAVASFESATRHAIELADHGAALRARAA